MDTHTIHTHAATMISIPRNVLGDKNNTILVKQKSNHSMVNGWPVKRGVGDTSVKSENIYEPN